MIIHFIARKKAKFSTNILRVCNYLCVNMEEPDTLDTLLTLVELLYNSKCTYFYFIHNFTLDFQLRKSGIQV